ncbi:hypothetical protein AAY473_016454 [Plecturocebus cupreus]
MASTPVPKVPNLKSISGAELDRFKAGTKAGGAARGRDVQGRAPPGPDPCCASASGLTRSPSAPHTVAAQKRSAGSRGSPPHSGSHRHLRTRVPAARRHRSSATKLGGSSAVPPRTESSQTKSDAVTRFQPGGETGRAETAGRGRKLRMRPAPARDPAQPHPGPAGRTGPAPARPRLFAGLSTALTGPAPARDPAHPQPGPASLSASSLHVRSGECAPVFTAKPYYAAPFPRRPPHSGSAGIRGRHKLGNRPPVGGEPRGAPKCSEACGSAARSASLSGSVTEVVPVRPFHPSSLQRQPIPSAPRQVPIRTRVSQRPQPRPSRPLGAALGLCSRRSSLTYLPILPSARPCVSADPSLQVPPQTGPSVQDGARGPAHPVTPRVLLHSHLPLAGTVGCLPFLCRT